MYVFFIIYTQNHITHDCFILIVVYYTLLYIILNTYIIYNYTILSYIALDYTVLDYILSRIIRLTHVYFNSQPFDGHQVNVVWQSRQPFATFYHPLSLWVF